MMPLEYVARIVIHSYELVVLSQMLFFSQSADTVFQGIREFGVSIMMNVAFLLILWYIATKILPMELERRQVSFDKQMEQLRADHKIDRDHDQEVIHLQRTEFLAKNSEQGQTYERTMTEMKKALEAMAAEIRSLRDEIRNRGNKT